jgi:hypothetical protein
MKQTVFVELDQETGELVLPLSVEICEAAGFKIGDTVQWVDNGNGTWSIVKKEPEMEWVLVDTVSQFRMRYMVQVPKGKKEYALDTVTMNEAKEFSQEHIGENIVSHRVVTEDEALAISDVDNHYCSSWTKEQKMNTFFTRDGEKADNGS